MTLDNLKNQRAELISQRSQAKDAVENTERALGQINFAIQALEADAKERKEEVEVNDIPEAS